MPTTTDPLDEILSIPEAAQQLDLPERDVRAFLADGSLRSAFDGYNRGLQWERTCAEVLKLRITRGGRSSAAEQPIAAGSGGDSLHFAALLASV